MFQLRCKVVWKVLLVLSDSVTFSEYRGAFILIQKLVINDSIKSALVNASNIWYFKLSKISLQHIHWPKKSLKCIKNFQKQSSMLTYSAYKYTTPVKIKEFQKFAFYLLTSHFSMFYLYLKNCKYGIKKQYQSLSLAEFLFFSSLQNMCFSQIVSYRRQQNYLSTCNSTYDFSLDYLTIFIVPCL